MHHNTDGIGVEIGGCAVSAVISMEQVRFEIGRKDLQKTRVSMLILLLKCPERSG